MPDQKHDVTRRIDGLVRNARWVLTFERLWPLCLLAASILAVFLALSWLGAWTLAPRAVRMAGVAALAAALAATAFLAYRAARVSRAQALVRLDRDSGLKHRPVSSMEDALANAGDDPTTRALWDIHRKRLDATLRRVRVAPPAPRVADRDPHALRALAVLVLVAAGFVAGPDKDGLLASAFDWRGDTADGGRNFRLDAWVDPPAYTGKAPVMLFASDQQGRRAEAATVPANSTVIVRSSGQGDFAVASDKGLKPLDGAAGAGQPHAAPAADRAGEREPSPLPKTFAGKTATGKIAVAEKRFTLAGDATLSVSHDGSDLGAVALTAVADAPPRIVLNGTPKSTPRGGLTLGYEIGDDYGVVAAEATFSDPAPEGRPASARVLVAPPKLALALPTTPGGLGKGQTTADLSDNPWAGATVTAVLTARDEGGNLGSSTPVRLVLPSRSFTKPLARALVEQRRNLIFDPDHREPIGVALNGLMIAPDRFGTSEAVYLGLYTANQRLEGAKTDDDLIGLAGYLWQMALRIEEGDLSQAQRDLRAAEKNLRDALERGAPSDEIKKLTEALQAEMNKLLAELMQQNQTAAQDSRADDGSKTVTSQDLQRMMQQMQEMAQAGDTEGAQRMLDRLQNLMENLKSARNGASNQDAREMNRRMNELDHMTHDQQALRDRTFKQGKQARRSPGGEPNAGERPTPGQGDMAEDEPSDEGDEGDLDAGQQPPPQPGDKAANEELKGQQQALAQRLKELRKQMRELGMKDEQGLDDAGQAMNDAEGALSDGKPGNRGAVDAQGRALEGLQKGAKGLAQQMAEAQGQGQGQGQGQAQGDSTGQEPGQGSADGGDTDPLGRSKQSRGSMETRGADIGESVAARAQRVLQELRRRLGDPSRPQDEQDYLERLLQR